MLHVINKNNAANATHGPIPVQKLFRDRTEATLDWRGPGPGPGPVLTLLTTAHSVSWCLTEEISSISWAYVDRGGLNKIFLSLSVCITGEPSIQHVEVESSPLSQGVADMSHSLAPSIQYHPGLPTPYMPPPPPPPGTMLNQTLFQWHPIHPCF